MRLPGDAWHRPYPSVHNFGNAVLVRLGKSGIAAAALLDKFAGQVCPGD